eukprot:7670667-Alexandrium_andersonii.AAC.1
MSASLVGSEMCIRDRLLPAQGQRRRRAAQRRRQGQPSEAAKSKGQFRLACLLYTSDAADDM